MQQTFWRLMRLAHWVIGAFILTTLTFFAVTGFMLNHTAWFEQEPTQHDAEYTLPAELATTLPALRDLCAESADSRFILDAHIP